MSDNTNQNEYSEENEINESVTEGGEIDTSSWIAGYTIPDGDSTATQSTSKESRALEICTLIFGVLAIIACCCYGIFGLLGVILSVVALTKGKKSGMVIAGLVCSVLGIILSLAVLLALRSDYFSEVRNAYDQYNAEKDYALQSEDSDKSNWENYLNTGKEEEKNVISSADAGVIILEGHEFNIPCKVSELLEFYEVSDYSKEDAEKELEPGDTSTIFLATKGIQNGISLSVENTTDAVLTDIREATIYCVGVVSDGEYSLSDVSIFNGIAFGMTSEEVEAALEGVIYEENEMNYGEDIYTFYNFEAGDDDEYSISVMLEKDVVISVDVFVY